MVYLRFDPVYHELFSVVSAKILLSIEFSDLPLLVYLLMKNRQAQYRSDNFIRISIFRLLELYWKIYLDLELYWKIYLPSESDSLPRGEKRRQRSKWKILRERKMKGNCR